MNTSTIPLHSMIVYSNERGIYEKRNKDICGGINGIEFYSL